MIKQKTRRKKKKLDKKPFYGPEGSKGYFNPSLTGKDFAESANRAQGITVKIKNKLSKKDQAIIKAEKARRSRSKRKAKPMGK